MSTDAKIIGGIVVATVVIIVGGIFLVTRNNSQEADVSDEQIISRKGIHWHPKLIINIKGQKQEIPANIGIGTVHQPIHTHEDAKDGVLHMEMKGLVTKGETQIGNFFRVWGKEFNSNCILDYCSGSGGVVKILINGQENEEFENYLMKDGDKIEIRYE